MRSSIIVVASFFVTIAIGRPVPASESAAKPAIRPTAIHIPAGALTRPLVYAFLNNAVITASGPLTVGGPPPPAAPGSQSLFGAQVPLIHLLHCNNVTVQFLDIDLANQPWIGIGTEKCTGCTIKGNSIHNVGTGVCAAIFALGDKNSVWETNTIDATGAGVRGMWIGNVHSADLETSPTLARNLVTHCGATGIGVTAVDAVVRCNESSSNQGAGIAISGSPKPLVASLRGVVEANHCDGNQFHGIQLDAYTAANLNTYPIVGTIIRGNSVPNNKHTGIYVAGGSNCTIIGNWGDGNPDGLYRVTHSFYCTVDGVLVCD